MIFFSNFAVCGVKEFNFLIAFGDTIKSGEFAEKLKGRAFFHKLI